MTHGFPKAKLIFYKMSCCTGVGDICDTGGLALQELASELQALYTSSSLFQGLTL